MSRSLPISLLFLLVAAGCGTLDNARDAQDLKKAPPGERVPSPEELRLPRTGRVDLAAMERAALIANPQLRGARRGFEAAAARVGEARGAYWPQVSTGPVAQYKYETLNGGGASFTPGAGGGGPSNTNDGHSFYAFGFQISWLLFDFGRTPALVRNAEKLALAADWTLKSTEIDVVFGVRSAYLSLVKELELLAVAKENVRQFEKHLEQTEAMFEVGRRLAYDVTKAKVDLGNAKLTEIQTRNAVALAQSTLANAIGLETVTDWAPDPAPKLPPFDLGFEAAWQIARTHQPKIAAALAQELGASALVDAQIAALYPSIVGSAGYSASGLDFPLVWNWFFGPSLNWTLFNGFQNYYTIDEAAANLRSSRAQRVAIEEQVWLDVRTAYTSLESARERLEITRLTVEQATQNLDLARGLFENGRATSIELTDAEAGLAQARGNDVQARADLAVATAQLLKSMGRTTWRP